MAKQKKTAREKVDTPQEIQKVEIPPIWEKSMGKGMMLIATPKLI